MFLRNFLAALAIVIAVPAYSECNISDNRGSNCVNMTGVTKETNGSVTAYKMKFEYSGGPGCPKNIPVEGITGSSNQPGTIVGIHSQKSTVTCTNTLGCSGFTGWMCKGDRGRRAVRDEDDVQSPRPTPNNRRKQDKQPSASRISECRVIDAYCTQECSDYYSIGTSSIHSAKVNDLTSQCLSTTCGSINQSCLKEGKIKKQDVINLFKKMPDNMKYHRQAEPKPAPKAIPRQANTKQSCRANYEKWIEVDPSNAKMQAAGAESYKDCLAGRDPDRALDVFLNDPTRYDGTEVASNPSPMDTLMPMLGGIAAARANSGNRGGYTAPSGGSTASQPTPYRAPFTGRRYNDVVRSGP